MSYEQTNSTNTTDDTLYIFKPSTSLFNFYYTCQIFLAIAGTLLNCWFLIAILVSQETRSRLRNKIICNTITGHLLHSAVLIPMSLFNSLSDQFHGCVFYSVFGNLQLINECIVNWLAVILIVVFISQIQGFSPEIKLRPKAANLGTIWILVFPWIASIIIVPIIVHDFYSRQLMTETVCFIPTLDSYQVIKSIDASVPMLLSVLLVITAAVLRYRRGTRRYSYGLSQAGLIRRGPEIDNISAYVAAVVVSIFCDILKLVTFMDMRRIAEYIVIYNVYIPAEILSDSRLVLMPLSWLLLPDVKYQIWNWRPWYRPAPGIDLAMISRNDEIV